MCVLRWDRSLGRCHWGPPRLPVSERRERYMGKRSLNAQHLTVSGMVLQSRTGDRCGMKVLGVIPRSKGLVDAMKKSYGGQSVCDPAKV